MGYMKDLKHLYLDQALASATGFLSSAVFGTFEKIDLPHLSRLLIGAPLSTNHAVSSSTILSLVIDTCDGAATFIFSAYARYFNLVSREVWDSNIPLLIDLNLSEDDELDEDRIISNICCSMSLSNVQSLFIIRSPFSPAFWRRMLEYFQDVRCIRLHAGNAPDLSVLSLTDLTTDEGVQNQDGLATGDRGQSHILAPRLEELLLDWITFLPERDSDLFEPAITRHSLLDSLSTRRGTHGRLTMTQCAIGKSDRFDSVMVWGDGGIHVVCDSEDSEE
ncbi:hypothetical protein L210DRAFT_3537785 [Boletus edulis BED1]|uniref:Uncharacterized protein n=1 Tax=Boletus edulis BED1 TaxID=1328754 RepID=A0AAD4GFQ2_BOLED|nr:hypothetical protein L210DRAFT_3537785 [Boletus edulis BED1]